VRPLAGLAAVASNESKKLDRGSPLSYTVRNPKEKRMALRGRPKNEPIAYDEEKVKEYITRWFTIEQEIKGLRESKGDLKDEYSKTVDQKLVANVVRLVKAQLKMSASPETVEGLSDLIRDKINMVI
jgi:uncharacterized protein (UPF0335 family)